MLDAAAALSYASATYPSTPTCDTSLVLWGQSLGAGVAVTAAAAAIHEKRHPPQANRVAELNHEAGQTAQQQDGGTLRHVAPEQQQRHPIHGLVLETPFTSVKAMVGALYPQKWLPYRYLGPFLWNHWDSLEGLRRMVGTVDNPNPQSTPVPFMSHLPKVLILQAGKDELVPVDHAPEMEALCRELGMEVKKVLVKDALHTDVMAKMAGRAAVVTFLKEIRHG